MPTATGGACQYHPFRFPWPLQQPFATSMFTQRLTPQIPTTQQLSFRGICPLQPSVPQGFPLPPKPAIPESSSPFFLMKLRETFPNATDGRLPLPWKTSLVSISVLIDGSKCWKLGREQRKYYHLNMVCLRIRHPWFHEGHLQSLLTRTEGGLTLTEELKAFIKQCFRGIAIE